MQAEQPLMLVGMLRLLERGLLCLQDSVFAK